jgi:hypothetical protein
MKREIKTVYDLKRAVDETGNNYFKRSGMKFFGDTMKNYGLRTVEFKDNRGQPRKAYELYRRKPVHRGIETSVYFDMDSFKRVFPKRGERVWIILAE